MSKLFGIRGLLVLLVSFSLASCTIGKKAVYFNDLPDSTRFVTGATIFKEPIIRPDDVLNVDIQTVDRESSQSISGEQQTPGYLVDKNGIISIPVFGDIEVAGLTTYEARHRIIEKVSAFYINPTVQVRFANYKITVLGEVSSPGIYTLPNEKVSLFDAIGMAGDLTIHGRRNNVLLVRDLDGHKEFVRLDLNSASVFESPYFYLQQNDLIYIEPGKGKTVGADTPRLQIASMVISFISVAVLLISRF